MNMKITLAEQQTSGKARLICMRSECSRIKLALCMLDTVKQRMTRSQQKLLQQLASTVTFLRSRANCWLLSVCVLQSAACALI